MGGRNVIIKDLIVDNKGWKYEPCSEEDEVDDVIRMRGYDIDKVETKIIHILKDGTREVETIGYTDTDSRTTQEANIEEDVNIAAKIAAEDKFVMEMLDGKTSEKVETQSSNTMEDITSKETPTPKAVDTNNDEARLSSKRAEIEAKVKLELAKREKEALKKAKEEKLAAEQKAREMNYAVDATAKIM